MRLTSTDVTRTTLTRASSLLISLGIALSATVCRADDALAVVHSVEGVSEYRLDNGLKILLVPDASVATLTINVIIRAGSRHEGYGETGAAHLLEHLQFKGTARYPNIGETMSQHGWAAFATTWYDHTNFIATMEGTEENLEQILRFEADRLTNGLLRQIDLEQEMPIVRNEFENSENSPWGLLPPRMRAISLEWHHYGKATIGNRADLENMPIERIRAFYRKYYQPDNATLVLAGRFEPEQALDAVRRYWGPIPRPTRELSEHYTLEPAQDGERLVTVRRAGGAPMAGVHYHIPGGAHADFAAVHVLASVLMGARPGELWALRASSTNGPLHKSLVGNGGATSVQGSISGLRQRGFLEFYAPCEIGTDPASALDRLIEVVEAAANADLTERDVRVARERQARAVQATIVDLPQLAKELTYWEVLGDWRLFFLHRDRLRQVELDDVRRVARTYLTRTNRTAGVYLPEATRSRVEIPPPPNVATLLESYESHEPVVAGEHLEPSPEAIEPRLIRAEAPCGMKIVLLPKRTRGDRVEVRMTLRYGSVDALTNRRAAASLLPDLVAGTEAKRTARSDVRGTMGAFALSASGGPGIVTFNMRCERTHLNRGFAILGNLLRDARISSRDLKALKQTRATFLQNSLDSPFALADLAVRRAGQPYSPADPRYIPTFPEELKQLQAVELGEVQRVWDDLVGASHGELVAVGSFDPREMIRYLDEATGDWTSPQPYAPLPLLAPHDPPSPPMVIPVRDKEAAAFAGELVFEIDENHEDYAALFVAQDILKLSRFYPRVNREEGLSYYYRADFAALPHSNLSRLRVRATCNPGNLTRLENAVRETFQSVHDTPFTEDEFEHAKTHLGHLTRIRLWNDDNLVQTLKTLAGQGRTLESYVELRDKIDSLTLADVRRAAERYLDHGKMIVATSGGVPRQP